MRPRALLLHGVLDPGGRPDEADTLVQVREIGARLADLGFATAELGLGLDLRPLRALARRPPEIVFYLVEALDGRAALQHLPAAILEAAGVRFTGAPAAALQLTTDKLAAKRLLRRAGLPTPDWVVDGAAADPERLWIVKAVDEDASLGLDPGSVVPGDRVAERLARCRARHGGRWFAEAFLDGREFNLALLERAGGPELLPIGEIDFTAYPRDRPRIVDYDAKWTPGSPSYETTPRIFAPRPGDGRLRRELAELALETWRLFGLRGYARVDIRLDAAGRPWILEVNANPCLSADAGYVAALEEAGLDQGTGVARILEAAGAVLPAVAPAGARMRRPERVGAG
jgi:D-alanine-D-alanine ligase